MNELLKVIGYALFGLYALASLWLLLNGLVQLHLLWHYKKKKARKPIPVPPASLPFVSIQVPVYNEKYVIRGLLQALARLDYPRQCFEIQVLDDSTDETSDLIDRQAHQLREEGVDISVLRRPERNGFKAGALQWGMAFCKGDFIAIFDADFRPDSSFLKNTIAYFTDAKIGLVQVRWTHLNREQNPLTHIQTFLLDTHFSIEQAGRFQAGYFINFCGTAGIWRKECIADAGGWDGQVLSEDLDLSYRAQLKGWKALYTEDVSVPAELPSVIEAFKIQQFRWTKGMAQISRKLLPKIIRTRMPFGKKLHAVFHLLSSLVFVCLLLNALFTVPLLVLRNCYPEFITLTRYTAVSSINLIALTLFYYNGTRRSDAAGSTQFYKHYPLFLVVYMALSVQNAVAVLEGLFGTRSVFVRTPKFAVSAASNNTYLHKQFNWINGLEVALFCYFGLGICLSFYLNDYFMLLFFLMIEYGLGFIIYQSLALVYPKRLKVA